MKFAGLPNPEMYEAMIAFREPKEIGKKWSQYTE
jgi:hypothetical protein